MELGAGLYERKGKWTFWKAQQRMEALSIILFLTEERSEKGDEGGWRMEGVEPAEGLEGSPPLTY
jgi:hypothetical protein